MPLLAILNLHVAFIAGHSNIKATAYHAEIITNSFPRHDSYVALCSASALARRQADSVVALYRLLLPFLSPTKLLSISLSLSLSFSCPPSPLALLLFVFSNTSCFLPLLLFLLLFFLLRWVSIHLLGTWASTRDWSAGYRTSQDHYQQERRSETALVPRRECMCLFTPPSERLVIVQHSYRLRSPITERGVLVVCWQSSESTCLRRITLHQRLS